MDAVPTVMFPVTVAVWGLFEVSLLVRDRGRRNGSTDHDRGTRILIRAALHPSYTGLLVFLAGFGLARRRAMGERNNLQCEVKPESFVQGDHDASRNNADPGAKSLDCH